MELPETIETLNTRLIEYFGIETESSDPIFRVVWSDAQYENRLTDATDTGIQLLHPEVRKLRKYPYVKAKYVLERLVLVPDWQQNELAGAKKSYEPIWVFQDSKDNAVPPVWTAIKLIIDTLYAALGKSSMAKYVDEEAKNPQEAKEKRIAKLEEELFGDESFLLGRTITGEAISMPTNYDEVK